MAIQHHNPYIYEPTSTCYTNLYTLQNLSTAMTVMLEVLVVAKYVLEKLGIPTLVPKLHSGQVNMDWNGYLDMHHISFTWHVYWSWGLYQYSNTGVNDRWARDNVMAWWWHLTSHSTLIDPPTVQIRKRSSICWIGLTEWLLFNANSAIFQLYHGENKLIFN